MPVPARRPGMCATRPRRTKCWARSDRRWSISKTPITASTLYACGLSIWWCRLADLDHHFAEGAARADMGQRGRGLIERETAVGVDSDSARDTQLR